MTQRSRSAATDRRSLSSAIRPRSPRRRLVAALALITTWVSACSIQADDAPRDIATEERGVLEPADPEAGEAVGAGRIFLVDGNAEERLVRSVLRNVDAAPEPLLGALLAGPNEAEVDVRLETAIPPTTELNSARLAGTTMTIDVSSDILELAGEEFVLATAQLVATASQLDGVRAVRFRVDGEARAWPNGAGELQEEALTLYDFPGLVESAQPHFPAVPSGA